MRHSNFHHMIMAIVTFLIANLLFMAVLYGYRKFGKGRVAAFSPPLDRQLRQANFLKLCVVFASVYFAASMLHRHTAISCDMLDEAAQCECYVLEVAQQKTLKQKLHWAHNGARMCPDSKFFTNFLHANPL